jgi:hypothetical protein
MNKSSVTLWVDTDTNNLLTGFNTNAVANAPTFKQGDNFELDVHFLKRTANSSIELPTAGSSYKLAIGNPDSLPTSGTWILAYGSSQVEFDYNETAASVESALNLIPEIITDGGVTVALVNGGTTYRVTFNNKVGLSSIFTTDASNLIPSSYASVSQIKTGSATTRGVWHIKLKQIPVAYQSTWTSSTAPVLTVTALDSNTSRVEITPAPKDGTFAVSGTYTGGSGGSWKSKPISVFATEQEVINAIGLPANSVLVSKSGLYSWDITILPFTTNSVAYNYITDDGDASGIIGYDYITGAISLNNYEVSALLGGASYVDTVLEIEVTTGSTVSTVLQTTCRIVAEVIGQGTYSPIPFDNPISQADLNSTLLNYVTKDGGTMNANAVLDFYNGVSDSEVGGWGFGVESAGGVNVTLVTHDVVSVQDGSGMTKMEATGVTFPDGSKQTTASVTVDVSGLVSKTTTSEQTMQGSLSIVGSGNYFKSSYAFVNNGFSQGILGHSGASFIFSNLNAADWASRRQETGSIDYQGVTISKTHGLNPPYPSGIDDRTISIRHSNGGIGDDVPFFTINHRKQTGVDTNYPYDPIIEEKEISIRPTGITFADASVQTTAGYPLNSNPAGYLTIGSNGTVPSGGLAGEVLAKASNSNYSFTWVSLSGYALLSGGTFTGKVNFTPSATTASINIGSQSSAPTTTVAGDVWIDNALRFKTFGGGLNVAATTNFTNTFSAPQIVSVSNTSAALRVTQNGTGNAIEIEDSANPDSTRFVIDQYGKVGVGVAPDTTAAIKVDTNGVMFGDATTQTTAYIPSNVALTGGTINGSTITIDGGTY